MPTLYRTLRQTFDALEGGETGTTEASTTVEQTQREARRGSVGVNLDMNRSNVEMFFVK